MRPAEKDGRDGSAVRWLAHDSWVTSPAGARRGRVGGDDSQTRWTRLILDGPVPGCLMDRQTPR